MRKFLIILLVALVFLAHAVSAYTYLNIYLDSSGNAQFLGQTNETNLSSLLLPPGISVQNGQISGITPDLTIKNKEIWTFSYYLQGADMKVTLPDNSRIQSINKGQIFLENGRISIYFIDGNSIDYTISDSAASPVLIIVILLLIVLLIVSYHYRKGIRKFLKPKMVYQKTVLLKSKNKIMETTKEEKLRLIKQVLNQREKIILENLEAHKKIKMSHLRKLTEIPKASFSRHIQELEKKGLVKRTGEGKNKFVELAK